ncbi:hypothetical protein F511_33605 [Dorcoceras hygrometricum]|uniref:Uncharacterized protein n=1 Tax=Dorcoceras hygrometricum TaxID=472368 RepID=A0A2Z7B3T0_9LAMI|nr:hypothetical protein F511_33605 [Dorcoceras hygrometricum]
MADEGVSFLVVDRIGNIYRNLPRRADVIVTTVGARHKCQQGSGFEPPMYDDICIVVFCIDRLPALILCSSAAQPGGGSGSPTVVSEPVFFGSDHTSCQIVSNLRFFRIEIKTLKLAARPPPCAAAPSSRRVHLRALDARWPRACRARGADGCCNRCKKLRQRATRLPHCVRPMVGAALAHDGATRGRSVRRPDAVRGAMIVPGNP